MGDVAGIVKELLAVLGVLLSAWAAKHARGARRDMQTNHGKRPGEYLEMVADIKQSTLMNTARMNRMTAQLAEHTEQDNENFRALSHALVQLRSELGLQPTDGDANGD